MYDGRENLETRTKIVATLGPAVWDEPTLTDLLRAGVDVARINCSHADHESIRRQVARVRRAALQSNLHVAILLDLQGPKIRTGKVPEPLDLPSGCTLTVVMDEDLVGSGTRVGTTYPEMADDVKPGDTVLFADGALGGQVTAVRHSEDAPAEVDIRITHGGLLGSHKGINLPGVQMSVPSVTDKDLADVEVGCEVGVDYVALSFVRSADDVQILKNRLVRLGQPDMPVIAKIEKPEAVEAIESILEVAEGVMVARGDLGVEVSIEKVPVYQKQIIRAAADAGRLCITATQMLDSMERNPRPTRAETTDVANAILDGTDAVMLSGETSVGDYPIEAVRMMDSIARTVESSQFFQPVALTDVSASAKVLIRAALAATQDVPRPVCVFTWTGRTVVQVSKTRPMSPIFALTPNQAVADRLALCWGVTPVVVPKVHTTDELVELGVEALLAKKLVQKGEEIVVLAGQARSRGPMNTLIIHRIEEIG